MWECVSNGLVIGKERRPTILSESMIACSRWATVKSVTSFPSSIRSDFWMIASVS